jgi:hypothetical protein
MYFFDNGIVNHPAKSQFIKEDNLFPIHIHMTSLEPSVSQHRQQKAERETNSAFC